MLKLIIAILVTSGLFSWHHVQPVVEPIVAPVQYTVPVVPAPPVAPVKKSPSPVKTIKKQHKIRVKQNKPKPKAHKAVKNKKYYRCYDVYYYYDAPRYYYDYSPLVAIIIGGAVCLCL